MATRKTGKRPQEAAPDNASPTTATAEAPTPQQVTGGGRKPPAFEFRCGRVKAVVWENHSAEHGKWYSVNLVRTYKDEATGNWKSASSFGRDDLLGAAECLRQAYLWVNDQLGGGVVTPREQSPQQVPPANGTPSANSEEPIPF